MNTEMMEHFEVLDADRLASVEGGNDIANTAGSAIAGGIIGYSACTASIVGAPFAWACAYIGAKFGASGYIIARYS